MIEKIIEYSIKNKLVIGIGTMLLVAAGIFSASQLSVDALPDITSNQVAIITISPNLAAQEVEQYITYPVEQSMANIQDVEQVRSTSRFGLSVVTIVFKDKADIYRSRQLVSEKLKEAEEQIPQGFGIPAMAPITTGLGEIYQYVIHPKKGFEDKYDAMQLREIQDWIVKRQMAGVKGVVEVSSLGGLLKQYEVAVDPDRLRSMNITIAEVFDALEKNNANTGASYIEKQQNVYFVRTEGLVRTQKDIENIVVKQVNNVPLMIKDIGEVRFGSAVRYGAMTRNGDGEVTGGIVLMLKGENSREVITNVKERMKQIQKTLPEGVVIEPFIDRTKLVNSTLHTISKNLLEGALIVMIVLIILLGNLRAGLIVASVIPLAMLVAIILMNIFGVTANLMSMGALDFGLIVDGAVIIVESVLHHLHQHYKSKKISSEVMNTQVFKSAGNVMNAAVFGIIIILVVYLPILSLSGIEGKMFIPMAQTVCFAMIGALILSLTYVPMMCALVLNKNVSDKVTLADKLVSGMKRFYEPALQRLMKFRKTTIAVSLAVLVFALIIFTRLGGEFLPTLSEGDFAIGLVMKQGTSLQNTINNTTQIEKILIKQFPEVLQVVNKIGSSEIPTDPMPIEASDMMVILKPQDEWTSASTFSELQEKMSEALAVIPGVNMEFTQPIQMRFNELIAGSRGDIAIKIFGDDLNTLYTKANEIAGRIKSIKGVTDIKVDQIVGLPQIQIIYNRAKVAQYGLNIEDLNRTVSSALAGSVSGTVYEGERRFDLVVRLEKEHRKDLESIQNLYVSLPDGNQIPLSQIADVSFKTGPSQVSRLSLKRYINVSLNVRGSDVQTVVEEIQKTLDGKFKLPAGYYMTYGGSFENLVQAKARLSIAVPVALLLILLLLFAAFSSITEALIIFSAVPFAAVGGILMLWITGLNFNISGGVGFIALFGVSVLFGILLINNFNRQHAEQESDIDTAVINGSLNIVRPVMAAALLAALGFLPMALSKGVGSEVQKPLALVVIGGIISATALTLFVLPVMYAMVFRKGKKKKTKIKPPAAASIILLMLIPSFGFSQSTPLTIEKAIDMAVKNHPALQSANYKVEEQKAIKKTSFSLPPTDVTGTFGQYNSTAQDRQIEASQSFSFPTVYAANKNVNEQKLLLAQNNFNITKNELIKNVSSSYYQLVYGLKQLQLFQQLDSIYSRFALSANRKYQAGESSLLEKTNAESQAQQVKLQLQQAQSILVVYQTELKQWLNTKDSISIATNTDWKMPPPLLPDTSALQRNPYYQFQSTLVNVAGAELKLQKQLWIPEFNAGYFNTSIDKVKGFQGFKVGAAIPLFKSGTGNRAKAAKYNFKSAQSDLENFKLELTTQITALKQEYFKNLQSLNFYEQRGIPLAEQLLKVAQSSYQQGDIGYLEFVQNIQQATELKSQYLQSLLQYNNSIIQINALVAQ